MHCFSQNRRANFKTLNQISNRYGAPLFPKNALRKGEKKLAPRKKFGESKFYFNKVNLSHT